MSSIEEPVLGALIMGKAAEAHERGVELTLNTGGSTAVTGLAVQDLVAILGNLLDNAIDAAAEAPAPRLVELTVETHRRRPGDHGGGQRPRDRSRGRGGHLPARLQHQGPGTVRTRALGWPWSARRCSGSAVP